MFFRNVQISWKHYESDWGLGRNVLFIIVFNVFLFLFGMFYSYGREFNALILLTLIPLLLGASYYFVRPHLIVKGNEIVIFLANALFIGQALSLNYFFIGTLDRMAQGFPRLDAHLAYWDMKLFGAPVATFIQRAIGQWGWPSAVLYDFMMVVYVSYYTLPILGAWAYLQRLTPDTHYKISQYFSSVTLFFLLNFTGYLLFPVTGPQYYLKGAFDDIPLPFSPLGEFLHTMVAMAQQTHIDCFPSGHVGFSTLIVFWFFKFRHPCRYLMSLVLLGVIGATLSMRYHYTLDLVASLPLVYISYKLSQVLFNK